MADRSSFKKFIQPSFFSNAADVFETFVFHALDNAEISYKEGAQIGSLYMEDIDQIRDMAKRARLIIKQLRDVAWSAIEETSTKIKRLGFDYETFIQEYLTPGGEITDEKRIEFCNNYIAGEAYLEEEDKIANYIKSMNYRDFLRTPYWIMISDARKADSNGCVCCGSTNRLEVHHPTYDWHGYEHRHFMELVPLCHKCHAKISTKKETLTLQNDITNGCDCNRRLDD